MKAFRGAAAALLCALLTGCMPFAAELTSVDGNYHIETTAENVEPAVGDWVADWQTEATLYYPAQNQLALVETRRTLEVGARQTLEERLIEVLLDADVPAGARSAAPEGTVLLSVRRSGSAAVVDLSAEAAAVENGQQLFFMRAAIARTLCAACNLEAVDVLINGRAASFSSLPQGALNFDEMPAASLFMQFSADEGLAAGGGDSSVERRAVLYAVTADGERLAPYARTLTIENGDSLSALIAALTEDTGDAYLPALLSSETPLVKDARLVDLSDGRRVARLTLTGGLIPNESEWMTYGALTCTLTGFIPALDGVQLYIGEGQLVRLDSPSGEVAFEDGVLTRAMFETAIGRTVTIYMTAENGSLRALTRSMAAEDVLSPRMTIAELFGEPRTWETGALRVVPDGLSIDDLLGVRIENGEAVLNFSARFYAGCQRLSEQQERNLVYALVNTLTERPDVNAVRFQFEGQAADKLVSSISLISPLLRNPGLIEGAEE